MLALKNNSLKIYRLSIAKSEKYIILENFKLRVFKNIETLSECRYFAINTKEINNVAMSVMYCNKEEIFVWSATSKAESEYAMFMLKELSIIAPAFLAMPLIIAVSPSKQII